MIRCSAEEAKLVSVNGGEILGVNLGYDYAAEHESGIKSLAQAFGIEWKIMGYEGRKNTIVPHELVFYEPHSALIYMPNGCSDRFLEHLLQGELSLEGQQKLAGAWSEQDFGLRVAAEYAPLVKELYEAFRQKNGIITLSPMGPFGGRGLILLDYRKIPENIKIDAREVDRKKRKAQELFRRLEQESGVFDLLRSKGLNYYYLRINRLNRKGEPLWWLNPEQQHLYHAGWYTTEDLKKWADGKGPIVRSER